jgi:hypothetical protein
MKEIKSPAQRYEEIHGFDESQARGRPCTKLPKCGNIPEDCEDAVREMYQTWTQLTTQRQSLETLVTQLNGEIETLKLEGGVIQEVHMIISDENLAPLPHENLPISDSQLEQPRDVANFITPTYFALRDNNIQSIDARVQQINLIDSRLSKLRKQAQKMSRISPQVAYLQACSEFYMLRQQEEVATRIAIEQARCFRRKLGLTVNQAEFEKEQRALNAWIPEASRRQTMFFDSRVKGNKTSKAQEEELEEEAMALNEDETVVEDST